MSHRLVDSEPDNATSWFAVGCYYYVIGRYEESRKYLHKATTLDRNLGTAWLMRGHAFAAENEHDQAMAAYFKASQLMRGFVAYLIDLIVFRSLVIYQLLSQFVDLTFLCYMSASSTD